MDLRYRLRFVCLWLSQAAALTADCWLLAMLLESVGHEPGMAPQVFAILGAAGLAAFTLLLPLNGLLSNLAPQRLVLFVTLICRFVCFGGMLALPFSFIVEDGFFGPALICLSIANAIELPVRATMLPAVAQDARLPLSRLHALMLFGLPCAALAGMTLAPWRLHGGGMTWPLLLSPVGLYLFSLVTMLLIEFPTDRRRLNSLPRGAWNVFPAVQRIWARRKTRNLCLATMTFWAIAGGTLALLLEANAPAAAPDRIARLCYGMVLGSILAGVASHPFRILGWIPMAWTGLLVLTVWLVFQPDSLTAWLILGFLACFMLVPLKSTFQGEVPDEIQGHAMAFWNAVTLIGFAVGSSVVQRLGEDAALGVQTRLMIISALTAFAVFLAWRRMGRPVIELVSSIIASPMYRFRFYGPGIDTFPVRGPVVVIANHAAWFDPLWLGKFIPRPITALMNSAFYDLPVIRWLMRGPMQQIRVQESRYRHDAPELAEAVAHGSTKGSAS